MFTHCSCIRCLDMKQDHKIFTYRICSNKRPNHSVQVHCTISYRTIKTECDRDGRGILPVFPSLFWTDAPSKSWRVYSSKYGNYNSIRTYSTCLRDLHCNKGYFFLYKQNLRYLGQLLKWSRHSNLNSKYVQNLSSDKQKLSNLIQCLLWYPRGIIKRLKIGPGSFAISHLITSCVCTHCLTYAANSSFFPKLWFPVNSQLNKPLNLFN